MPDTKSPTYVEVVDVLSRARMPLSELHGPGCIAVIPPAGRIVAMAFSQNGENLLWSNPRLADTDLSELHPEKLATDLGGDRLWFAPEVDYHWNGPARWDTFANYQVPAESDPGAYRFFDAGPDAIGLRACASLTNRRTGDRVGFDVRRIIRRADPPLPMSDPFMKGVDYVGIETSHALKLDDATKAGRIDLWHILQVPAGSTLIVPLVKAASAEARKPVSYGGKGGWKEKPDGIFWRYTGDAASKFGLSAAACTGRTAVLRELGPDRWCLIVREFPVHAPGVYGDHPDGISRTDQVFQAWDGFGFAEMEFHSPVLDAQSGPRALEESDRLWAFGGNRQAIAALTVTLLGFDLPVTMNCSSEPRRGASKEVRQRGRDQRTAP